MNRGNAWRAVDILILKRIQDRRCDAVRPPCLDVTALLAALPSPPAAQGAPAFDLMDADDLAWRAWITRVVEALPTQTPFSQEAAHGVA